MTTQRITTDRELAQLRSSVARSQVHASKLRERSTRPSVEDIAERMRTARERVPAGEGKPIPAEVTAENARALHAILNNTPDLATRALGEQFETCWAASDSIESRWDDDNPRHRWIHMLFGAPAADVLRRPADDAAARYANVFGDDPRVPVIASTVDGFTPRVMDSATDLNDAYATIGAHSWCDLRLSDGTEFGSCIDHHNSRLEGIARHDGYDEHGVWGKMRRAYLAKEFVTVPFARGDLLILARFCTMCLSYFLVLNGVDPRECRFEQPYSDGFAPYAFKPLPPRVAESDCVTDDDDESTDVDP